MDEIRYYCAYRCLEHLLARKKVTIRIANKILKEYEEEYHPLYVHKFR